MDREKMLDKYYNKHKEDLRLTRRHGMVEYRVSMKYILELLPKENKQDFKILDLGAATGRYSIALKGMGYDVTAVELVKHNLDIMKKKDPEIKAFQGNAKNIGFLADNTFDLVINFGPLYHLIGDEEKLIAMNEAKRVTKPNGLILNAYVMNEYCVLSFCFDEDRMPKLREDNFVDDSFHVHSTEGELYDYVRISDIDRLNQKAGLTRIKIFSPDGPSDYMRPMINKMSEESFERFVEFQMANAEREDLIGAGSHVVDIVRK
ncbi:MAG: methyltransferase domain-containing protein [Paludibacteraceae bacterium]|nr:methyltransferase domain-containing protein [Paludibacteraceae bacterium]